AESGPDPRGAPRRHRPRAARQHRRAGHGPLDRRARGRERRRHGLAHDAGLPDPQPLRDRRPRRRRRTRGRDPRRGQLRRPQRDAEGRAAAQARPPRRAARGRARPGGQRPVRRLRQGRRRQVDADRQPRRRARGRGQEGRRARRRRLGLLDPAHARPRRRPATGQRAPQDRAAGVQRHQGDVDRLLRAGGLRGRLARADAAQGAHPVPRGRRVGRARPPARRPPAGHRRRVDDALAAPARREVPHRHDPAADRPEGRPPCRRDGEQGRPRDRRRRREHVRLHDAGRRALPDLRRGRRSGAGRRARRPAHRQGPADHAAARAGRRRGAARRHRPRRRRRRRDPPGRARDHRDDPAAASRARDVAGRRRPAHGARADERHGAPHGRL
ncbi:MAG: Mrp protein homolog, partial [uncultured Solirubrobacteraceae bacterium]